MSSGGCFAHIADFVVWLGHAQKALVVKNKVRKELWSELADIVTWDAYNLLERNDYFRIPNTAFVAIQTFCLVDGKSDNLSSDQILNWCTTLADLRSRVAEVRPSNHRRTIPLRTGELNLTEAVAKLAAEEEEKEPVVHT
jgi:hypothetical protein